MRKAILVMALAALAVLLGPRNFAAEKHYIITNDDNPNHNTATIFEVNTETGALTQGKSLVTGGIGLNGGFFAAPRNAIDGSGRCFFVSDAGSGDIASFTAPPPRFLKVGNYSNAQLSGNYAGIGLAASPNGRYLFAAYSGSSNIAVWNINSDCSLTLNGNPYADGDQTAMIAVNNAGTELVVPLPDLEEIASYSIGLDGVLTAQPALDFSNVGECATRGCFPAGLDITNDGKIVVAGNASATGSYAILTASLSGSGLSTPGYHTHHTLTIKPETVWFSPAAANGHGILYVSMAGQGRSNFGVVTVEFNEEPLTMTYLAEFEDSGVAGYGMVQTIGTSGTGGLIAVPNASVVRSIDVYRVDPNSGKLTALSSIYDQPTNNLMTITAFPKRPTD